MALSRAADLYFTYRFLKLLVTPWPEMEAFKLGIIDNKGTNLIKTNKLSGNDQKDAFTTFHRLVFNIKRMMEKIPFGKSRIASYAAALYLLREETGMSEEALLKVMDELGVDTELDINEQTQTPGQYILSNTVDNDHPKGSVITVESVVDYFSGIPIYNTTENIYVTSANIS
jgi:hypothetical protein